MQRISKFARLLPSVCWLLWPSLLPFSRTDTTKQPSGRVLHCDLTEKLHLTVSLTCAAGRGTEHTEHDGPLYLSGLLPRPGIWAPNDLNGIGIACSLVCMLSGRNRRWIVSAIVGIFANHWVRPGGWSTHRECLPVFAAWSHALPGFWSCSLVSFLGSPWVSWALMSLGKSLTHTKMRRGTWYGASSANKRKKAVFQAKGREHSPAENEWKYIIQSRPNSYIVFKKRTTSIQGRFFRAFLSNVFWGYRSADCAEGWRQRTCQAYKENWFQQERLQSLYVLVYVVVVLYCYRYRCWRWMHFL